MFDFIQRLWDEDALSPHGICLLWRPELIWTHVVSDSAIALAYFSIPCALAYFVARRRDVVFGWVFWAFAFFILACGTTHLFSIWTLWVPDYGAEALVKAVTAVSSIVTAALLWRLMPQALALPSPTQLRIANDLLSARIAERDQALEDLKLATARQMQAEEALRQSQKMEALGHLTGGLAHDFNNMLSIVICNLERVEDQLDPASRMAGAVRDAMAGAERAAAVTLKLLAFGRKQSLSPVSTDVNTLIANFQDLLRGAVGAHTRLDVDLAPGLGPIDIDANQFENAILNLTVNARDAMPGGGILTITTRDSRPEDAQHFTDRPMPERAIVVEVSDTGSGMSPDVVERAFEPFFTTKPVGQGTGLGLSQVFGFVQQSGGSAAIVSVPGHGTSIRLLFPVASAATAMPRAEPLSRPAGALKLTESMA